MLSSWPQCKGDRKKQPEAPESVSAASPLQTILNRAHLYQQTTYKPILNLGSKWHFPLSDPQMVEPGPESHHWLPQLQIVQDTITSLCLFYNWLNSATRGCRAMAHIKLRHKGRVTPHRGLTPTCMRWHTDISTYFLAHTSTGKTFCWIDQYWIGRFLSCPTCWRPSEWGQKACSWGKLLGKTN